MGKTSNKAKQQWNAGHYTQVKAYIRPEIASAFKAKCIKSNASMAGEISAFMEGYTAIEQTSPTPRQTSPAPGHISPTPVRVKTLGDRRKAMQLVIELLTEIHDAEEAYVANTPENLRSSSRYEMAEERLERLSEVLEAVDGIYDQ